MSTSLNSRGLAQKTAWLTGLLLAVFAGAVSVPVLAQVPDQVRVSSFEYDADGLLIKETVEPDNLDDCLQKVIAYDKYGNRISETSSACPGATGTATWSATQSRGASSSYDLYQGRFADIVTNAKGHVEQHTVEPRFGAMVSLKGPNNLYSSWTYDKFGRKTQEVRSDGSHTLIDYWLCGTSPAQCEISIGGATVAWVQVEKPRAPNGGVAGPDVRTYYDMLGRVLRKQTTGFDATAGAGAELVQDTWYNAVGQVAKRSEWHVKNSGDPTWAVFEYDELNRVTRETYPAPSPEEPARVATTGIDYNGLISTRSNARGFYKTTTKNAQGKPVLVVDSLGQQVGYSYDAVGNLLSTNASGRVTTLSYDRRGQKTSMQDPVMGAWAYAYNVFGELVWQSDSLGRTTTMAYDQLGRMTNRNEADLTSTWTFDTCTKGKLCKAESSNGYRREHYYDGKTRPMLVRTYAESPTQYSDVRLNWDDSTGRLVRKDWPIFNGQYQYRLSYEYTTLGFLKRASGEMSSFPDLNASFEVLAMDPRGQISQYKYGNQITTVVDRDLATGKVHSILATRAQAGDVLNHSYRYDVLGNLSQRNDATPGMGTQESFAYDYIDRLVNYTMVAQSVSPPRATEVRYDARGNITYRSDTGRYVYDPLRPGRLVGVVPETAAGAQLTNTGSRTLSYVFDDAHLGAQVIDGRPMGNGNLEYTQSADSVTGLQTFRRQTYNSFNMPVDIVQGAVPQGLDCQVDTCTPSRSLSFAYGPEHQRVKQVVTGGAAAGTTWYFHEGEGLTYEKFVKADGVVEHKYYLSAGGMVFAIGTMRSNYTRSANYLHHDYLGSAVAVSDAAGTVIERMAYDPWGKRRQLDGNPDAADAIVGVNTDRGFTMHEHLDEVGLVHMNGRLYDPLVGRFVSADPFIQAPDNLQSYNRYAYVMNNPLAFTDPSGYFSLKKAIRTVVSIYIAIVAPQIIISNLAGTTAAAAASCTAAGAASVGTSLTIASGVGAGFLTAAVATGSTESAFQGALAGGAFGAASQVGTSASIERALAHAAAGCVSNAFGGGSCANGAISAGVAKFVGANLPASEDKFLEGVKYAVIGGTASILNGGKFENGAVTAGFGYLFNHLVSIGINIRVPFVGGAKYALGVSYEKGQWDAGVIIDSDIPVVNVGKMIGKSTVDVSYQTGDFKSNSGELSTNFEVGAKSVGINVQRGPNGVSGGGFSIGPQLGIAVSGQQTSTLSYRTHVIPLLDKLKNWLNN
ncbi:MAG: type IV secretion protein Rhs [Ramlibacter sp.]|nr:type IV secretion protein Rhs [Ramlibacter sp.]